MANEMQIAATGNHSSHTHEAEACTPFCSCSCCAASVHDQAFIKPQALKPIIQPGKYIVINESYLFQEISSIWQPPKSNA